MFRPLALSVIALAATAAPAMAAPASVVPLRVCDEAHLRAAIASAPTDATIRWQCDGTITVGSTIEVIDATRQRDLTLDGGGRRATISGGGEVAPLWLAGPNSVTLRRLTFTDGANRNEFTSGGGAVTTFTPLVVDRVTFRGNSSINAGGAIAVRSAFGALDVRDSVFEGNTVTCHIASAGTSGGGGAISARAGGPTIVRGSHFVRNLATGACVGGGAVLAPRGFSTATTGPVTIERSRFDENRAEVGVLGNLQPGGGAVAVYNHALSIAGSTFTRNDVASASRLGLGGIGFGGAVYADQQTDGLLPQLATRISDSVFTGNAPSADDPNWYQLGGALAFRDLQGTPVVESSRLSGNRADDGGAIYAASPLTVDLSQFHGNSATRTGGAIRFAGAWPATLGRTVLVGNTPEGCSAGDPALELTVSGPITERPTASCAALAR